ncbi:MAG: zf-HC2 domain-containing protein [Terracidiphilus sp.]|jgi:hypothetical protein
MKQFEYNPLQQELARSRQVGPHPDSDLLTAFAEGTLLERERQEVFAHLATCADCRELLSAATATAPRFASRPIVGSKPFVVHRSAHPVLRAWLPWASIAAGIFLVTSVGWVYKQKLELKQRVTTAAKNEPDVPSTKIQQEHPAPVVEPEKQISKTAPGSPAKQLKTTQSDSGVQSRSASKSMSEDPVTRPSVTARNSSTFANTDSARALSNLSVTTPSVRPHWRIDSLGHAERSFGDGAWQPVLPNEIAKMRVVSVFDAEVWIGGESARLYRSSDNGNSWIVVPLPMKNGTDHVIVHIRFQTPKVGTVEASDGTSWTTQDSGASWN